MVKFLAIIPMIQTAIKISGDGGARIQLEVPETDVKAVFELAKMKEQILRVEIYGEDED